MYFIIKSAFCLALVFFMLPEDDANRVQGEVTRAVTQDKMVKATIERTNLATQKAISEAERMCVKNHEECIDIAKQVVKNATNRW